MRIVIFSALALLLLTGCGTKPEVNVCDESKMRVRELFGQPLADDGNRLVYRMEYSPSVVSMSYELTFNFAATPSSCDVTMDKKFSVSPT